MTYHDSLASAARHLLDLDLPESLLPLAIMNEAVLHSGRNSDCLGHPGWD